MRAKTNSPEQTESYGIEKSKLSKLFEDCLKDIYWAEKALTTAMPKMIKNASSPKLVQAIEKHLAETKDQILQVEKVFEILGKKAVAKKCEAMAGLIEEAKEIMEETEEGAMRDAGIIAAAQKVEHYEIATYGTLRTYAGILGLKEGVKILESILNQEKTADQTLTGVASSINLSASKEEA